METIKEKPFKKRKFYTKEETIAELAAMSPEEQEKNWEKADILRSYINAINYHERIGFEEGYKEGLVIGIKESGKEEANIETAKKMKEKGLDLELIHEITGLSLDKIQEL
jgi:predicted transposase/invertase (TIGR01784 family)